MQEILVAITLLGIIPIEATIIFVLLTFRKLGYGPVGKLIAYGFSILGTSLLFIAINYIAENDLFLVISGIARILGWTFIAVGFIVFFKETEKGI